MPSFRCRNPHNEFEFTFQDAVDLPPSGSDFPSPPEPTLPIRNLPASPNSDYVLVLGSKNFQVLTSSCAFLFVLLNV